VVVTKLMPSIALPAAPPALSLCLSIGFIPENRFALFGPML
jgi:hypothetical protein